ncbi:hypothetical protein M5D96_002610, partial [Drosophila gunungcola]
EVTIILYEVKKKLIAGAQDTNFYPRRQQVEDASLVRLSNCFDCGNFSWPFWNRSWWKLVCPAPHNPRALIRSAAG